MVARNLEPLKLQINIVLTVLATVFVSVATAIDWWTQGYGDTAVRYTIWKPVECTSGVCLVSNNSSGWINFVRLMLIVGLTGFAGTLVVQLLYMFKPLRAFRTTIMVFCGISGVALGLNGFVISGFFHGISKNYNTATLRRTFDSNALRYGTLPLGFIFLASFIISVVGVFTLVNVAPKPKRKSMIKGEYELAPMKSDKAVAENEIRKL